MQVNDKPIVATLASIDHFLAVLNGGGVVKITPSNVAALIAPLISSEAVEPIYFGNEITPTNGQVIGRFRVAFASVISSTNANHGCKCSVAPTSAYVITMYLNGTARMTFSFAASASVATVAFSSGSVNIAPGDILTFEGQATADPTIAGIAGSIVMGG